MPQNAKAVQKERERAAFKAFALELDAANKLAEERQVRANNLKRERDAVASEVAGLRSKLADADAQTASLLATIRQLEAAAASGVAPATKSAGDQAPATGGAEAEPAVGVGGGESRSAASALWELYLDEQRRRTVAEDRAEVGACLLSCPWLCVCVCVCVCGCGCGCVWGWGCMRVVVSGYGCGCAVVDVITCAPSYRDTGVLCGAGPASASRQAGRFLDETEGTVHHPSNTLQYVADAVMLVTCVARRG